MFGLFKAKKKQLPDYTQVSESLVKVQTILKNAKSLREVEVAERMFVNFLKVFSTEHERQSSHIIYGIQMNINERRAEFEQSREVPYDQPAQYNQIKGNNYVFVH